MTLDAATRLAPSGVDLWPTLAKVRDPELDQPVTELGFVVHASVHGGQATVELQLPNYFCAPHLAYLMVADTHDAVRELSGIDSVSVRLVDHFAADEVNAGCSEHGPAGTEFDELRAAFRRKAYFACLDRLGRTLVAEGNRIEHIVMLRLGDLAPSAQRASLLRRREALGLDCSPGSPVLVDEHDEAIPPEQAAIRLRLARSVPERMEGNASFCRRQLRARYPQAG